MNRSRSLLLALTLLATLVVPSSALAAYGDLDARFGAAGIALVPKAGDAVGMHALTGGGVLYATDTRIARLTSRGKVDKAFKFDRKVLGSSYLSGFGVLSDGRIVAITATSSSNSRAPESYIYAFKSDGRLDRSFGTGGKVTLGPAMAGFRATSMAVQQGTKILVAGYLANSKNEVSVRRFGGDGSLDASFGAAGTTTISAAKLDNSWDSPARNLVSTIATNASGSIFVGAEQGIGGSQGCVLNVARLDRDGVRDSSYGTGGLAELGRGCYDLVSSSAADDGRVAVVVRGYTFGKTPGYVYAAHFFDAGGQQLPSTVSDYQTSGVKFLPNGDIVRGGISSMFADRADRSPIDAFGASGVAPIIAARTSGWGVFDVASDGSIFAAPLYDRRPRTSRPVVRLLGPGGGKAAPQVAFGYRPESIYPANDPSFGFTNLAGTAAPAGSLKRVEVAIQRVDDKLTQRGRCIWIKAYGKSTSRTRARGGKCLAAHFMPATGTDTWSFSIVRDLSPGKYRVYLRATTDDDVSTPFTKQWDWYDHFRIAKP